MARLTENLGAAKVELTAADLAGIGAALEDIRIEGERYPAQYQAAVNR